jgi:hypothetical protein
MIEIGDRIEDPRVGVAGVTVTAAYRVWVAEWLPLASGTPVSALDVSIQAQILNLPRAERKKVPRTGERAALPKWRL